MVRHISKFNINSFKGIKDLVLKDLGDVNILVGTNNCGKTSVLESIMLLSKPDEFANVVSIARLREGYKNHPRMSASFFDSFMYLFNRLSNELIIGVSGNVNSHNVSLQIKGKIEKLLMDLEEMAKYSPIFRNKINEQRITESEEVDTFVGELQFNNIHVRLFPNDTIPISFNKYERLIRIEQNKPFLNMIFVSAIDHIVKNTFREIIKNKEHKNEVVNILKLFDSNIVDLRIIQDEDGRINQIIENTLLQYMPLSTYGDGIKKVIALANGVAEAKNGVLLVDEIETSIHVSALKKVFCWLIKSCEEFNVQLFFTTHSLETVDAILNCDYNVIQKDLIRVITLVKKENKTVARILTGEKALQVRDDFDMELRK